MKKMLLSFLGVMSAASLLAQTIDISGTVFDENNKPMNGCYIHTSEYRYTMSDSLGHYSIPVSYGDEVALDDHDMWDVVCRQCRTAYKVSGPKDLSPEDRISLARQLKFEYNASNAQISRCLGILRNAVDQIFPLSSR